MEPLDLAFLAPGAANQDGYVATYVGADGLVEWRPGGGTTGHKYTNPDPNSLQQIIAAGVATNTETVIVGCADNSAVIGKAGTVTVSLHGSVNQPNVSKKLQWTVRDGGPGGIIIAQSPVFTCTVDSTAGDDSALRWGWSGIYTPTTATICATATMTSGNGPAYSNLRTFTNDQSS